MNECKLCSQEHGELSQMHQEIKEMHQEIVASMKLIASLISQLKVCDQSTRGLVENLTAQAAFKTCASQIPSNCPHCGSRLHHHKAEAGELVDCPACGWSEFVDAGGHPCNELGSLPPVWNAPQHGPWAAT